LAHKFLANQPSLFYSLGSNATWDACVTKWLNEIRAQGRTGISAPGKIVDVRTLVDEMRLYKSGYEIDIMRQSAKIAAAAHQRGMQIVQPGMMEYEIEAEFLHEFYRHGAQAPAYTSIVAGGVNACTLHY